MLGLLDITHTHKIYIQPNCNIKSQRDNKNNFIRTACKMVHITHKSNIRCTATKLHTVAIHQIGYHTYKTVARQLYAIYIFMSQPASDWWGNTKKNNQHTHSTGLGHQIARAFLISEGNTKLPGNFPHMFGCVCYSLARSPSKCNITCHTIFCRVKWNLITWPSSVAV